METPDPPKNTHLKPLKTGSNLTLSHTEKTLEGFLDLPAKKTRNS